MEDWPKSETTQIVGFNLMAENSDFDFDNTESSQDL